VKANWQSGNWRVQIGKDLASSPGQPALRQLLEPFERQERELPWLPEELRMMITMRLSDAWTHEPWR
jgi:hypothetical protein